MRTSKNDNNSFSPYKRNEEVEAVVEQSYIQFIQSRIDDALDKRMHVTNPVEFQMLVDLYLGAKKSVDKS